MRNVRPQQYTWFVHFALNSVVWQSGARLSTLYEEEGQRQQQARPGVQEGLSEGKEPSEELSLQLSQLL